MNIENVGWVQVVIGIIARFWPVWLAMALVMGRPGSIARSSASMASSVRPLPA
jgi:hypothetical protein